MGLQIGCLIRMRCLDIGLFCKQCACKHRSEQWADFTASEAALHVNYRTECELAYGHADTHTGLLWADITCHGRCWASSRFFLPKDRNIGHQWLYSNRPNAKRNIKCYFYSQSTLYLCRNYLTIYMLCNNCEVVVSCKTQNLCRLYYIHGFCDSVFCYLLCAWSIIFLWWMITCIFQSLTIMLHSCFAFRQAAHFLRPVIRRLPSSALTTSPFISLHHTDARSAASLFHCASNLCCICTAVQPFNSHYCCCFFSHSMFKTVPDRIACTFLLCFSHICSCSLNLFCRLTYP